MELLEYLVDLFLHLDKHLDVVIQQYGAWTYLILLVIIFCETGLVVTPFLPGDSLLFAAGTFAAHDALDVNLLFVLLSLAAIVGDTANYWIGAYIGPRAFSGKIRFLNQRHLQRTHEFYERHGGKTIILARFIPIIRTFAPFVAGIGAMNYARFIAYNVVGGIAWVATFVYGGYAFGGLETVRRNFTLVILAIIVISVLPIVVEFLRARFARSAPDASTPRGIEPMPPTAEQMSIVPLTQSQVDSAAGLMARAFADDPFLEYIFPNRRRRARQMTWFSGTGVRFGLRCGQGFTTPDVAGLSLWLPPGSGSLSLSAFFRTGALLAPLRLGIVGSLRFLHLIRQSERLHKQAVMQPHWHLFILAVDPAHQGQGLGGTLIRAGLDKADRDGLPCYVETTNLKNIAYYQRHGFELVGQIALADGLTFCGMLRPASKAARASAG